jgi:Family of unknown function (DUF6152)
MKRTFIGTLLASALLIASTPLAAHHGNASFDPSKRQMLEGTVTEWLWSNPHCFLKVDAKDDTGAVRNWNLELGNPTDMTAVGFKRTSFKAGDKVTVTVIPVKSGAPVGRLLTVQLPDGSRLPQLPQ